MPKGRDAHLIVSGWNREAEYVTVWAKSINEDRDFVNEKIIPLAFVEASVIDLIEETKKVVERELIDAIKKYREQKLKGIWNG
jgi:hypothetical protein